MKTTERPFVLMASHSAFAAATMLSTVACAKTYQFAATQESTEGFALVRSTPCGVWLWQGKIGECLAILLAVDASKPPDGAPDYRGADLSLPAGWHRFDVGFVCHGEWTTRTTPAYSTVVEGQLVNNAPQTVRAEMVAGLEYRVCIKAVDTRWFANVEEVK